LATSNNPLILAINPGSTSTKVAIFAGNRKIKESKLNHSQEELDRFNALWDQFDMRLKAIQDFLADQNYRFDAVVGRGGLLKPVRRGTYLVNDAMLEDARAGVQGEHVSNLGCALAYRVAQKYGCNAYVVDPVSVDEFQSLARYSGHPLITRRSLSHALNIRAAAIWAAEQINKDVTQTNYIVAHMGGGISVAPVQGGSIIDVNDASSDGPFSPERTGGLPLQPFIDLCFSGRFSRRDMKRLVMGNGGLVAYLNTNDLKVVEEKIRQGDDYAREVFQAMIYQIAKEIGAMSTVLHGQVQRIVLTGGLARSDRLVTELRERVQFIAPVIVIPGELEMEAMAAGVLRVLSKQEQAKTYP